MLFLYGSLSVTGPGSRVCSGKEAPAWGPLTAFGAEPKCGSKAESLVSLGKPAEGHLDGYLCLPTPLIQGVTQGKAFQQSHHWWPPLLVLVFSRQEERVCATDLLV